MRARSPWLVLLLVVAFGCGSSGGDGSDGGGSPDGSSGGPDADVCTGGTLCGMPASCCPAGNECIEGACLPTCESGVRCGADLGVCCAAGDVCLGDACATPSGSCLDSYDCEPGQFCEPTLGQCLPQPDPLTCEFQPSFDQLQVTVEWKYDLDQIISIPVVADVDGDGKPEVVVNAARQGGEDWPIGSILVLSGESGAVALPKVPHDPDAGTYGSHGRSTIAVGDVSGDGKPDIIYASRPVSGSKSLIVAIEGDGTPLWTSFDDDGAYYMLVENGAATLANFDDDPQAEVLFGGVLIDHDGRVVWDAGTAGSGAGLGTNAGYYGGIAVVADLDDDDAPEIITGKQAWKVAWNAQTQPPTVTVTPYWTYTGPDGYPAVADIDGDGVAEVVLVGSSTVQILEGRTGLLWCGTDPGNATCPDGRTPALAIPGGATSNRGGPPTIADFDADGRPEIGIAGGYAYSVYDVNRPGEDIVKPPADPTPAAGAMYVRWSKATQDLSSNATGSSVFDFQGDGAAEVVYADECYLRVYSGTDGTPQLETPNSSATIHEYPLVVDVDADGNSEILVVANDKPGCPDASRWGLYVYGDANDEWVPTRRVWTQHAYHVTNATSDGNVPMVEADNWTTAGLNNYRQNVQGDGVFNAPDLTLDLSVGLDACGAGMVVLRARVSNVGALGVPMGAEVRFYQGTDATGTYLGSATTPSPLLPGQSTIVTVEAPSVAGGADYYAEVDGAGVVTAPECDAENNDDGTGDAGCIVIE